MLRHGSLRYELLGPIGSGGMGDVHAARVVGGLERLVCIKRLAGALTPDQVGALREEARVLARVRHANVVSFHAFAEDEVAGPFLVLELVEGLDLRALCRGLAPDRLAPPVAVHVVCALLRALAAVQQCVPGLVHRDVTPHNVLVSRHGEVKLGDFGIALARDRAPAARPRFVRGKPGYMSPEQLRGDELDARSDQFSVGVLLYELLCGERPWGRRGLMHLLASGSLEPAPPLSGRGLGVPEELSRVVDRLLAPVVSARFLTPEDALRALAPFGAGELGSLRLASLVGGVTAARAATATRAGER